MSAQEVCPQERRQSLSQETLHLGTPGVQLEHLCPQLTADTYRPEELPLTKALLGANSLGKHKGMRSGNYLDSA